MVRDIEYPAVRHGYTKRMERVFLQALTQLHRSYHGVILTLDVRGFKTLVALNDPWLVLPEAGVPPPVRIRLDTKLLRWVA